MGNNGTENQHRDASEYVEASCLPNEIEDSLEDIIREAAHPHKLPDIVVVAIARRVDQLRESVAGLTPAEERYAQAFREFIEEFVPKNWSLVSWYGLQFAAHTRHVENLTLDDAARMLGCKKQAIHWNANQWRKRLDIYKENDLRRRGNQIARRRFIADKLKKPSKGKKP